MGNIDSKRTNCYFTHVHNLFQWLFWTKYILFPLLRVLWLAYFIKVKISNCMPAFWGMQLLIHALTSNGGLAETALSLKALVISPPHTVYFRPPWIKCLCGSMLTATKGDTQFPETWLNNRILKWTDVAPLPSFVYTGVFRKIQVCSNIRKDVSPQNHTWFQRREICL